MTDLIREFTTFQRTNPNIVYRPDKNATTIVLQTLTKNGADLNTRLFTQVKGGEESRQLLPSSRPSYLPKQQQQNDRAVRFQHKPHVRTIEADQHQVEVEVGEESGDEGIVD